MSYSKLESDETASCSQNIVRQGAVSMRKDSFGNWIFRRKWFVLTEQTLDIYGSEAGQQQGVLWLRNIVKIERTHSYRKPYCLVLETKHRRYFLALTSDEELYGWLDDVYSTSALGGGDPTSFLHKVHVSYDPVSGFFTGMPKKWRTDPRSQSTLSSLNATPTLPTIADPGQMILDVEYVGTEEKIERLADLAVV